VCAYVSTDTDLHYPYTLQFFGRRAKEGGGADGGVKKGKVEKDKKRIMRVRYLEIQSNVKEYRERQKIDRNILHSNWPM